MTGLLMMDMNLKGRLACQSELRSTQFRMNICMYVYVCRCVYYIYIPYIYTYICIWCVCEIAADEAKCSDESRKHHRDRS